MAVVSDIPRQSIFREKHLEGGINRAKLSKVGNELSRGLDALVGAQEIRITRVVKRGGTICKGVQQYKVTNEDGNLIYIANEESSCCCVHCCGPARSYSMMVEDKAGNAVMHFDRPVRCDDACWCCCGCALMRMRVKNAQDVEMGEVEQKWSLWKEKFSVVTNPAGETWTIYGPCLTCRCLTNMSFEVISDEKGEMVGSIWKRWIESDEAETNEDHEHFGVSFTQPSSPNSRALLLAAAFLLNHMFFEMS